VNGGPYSVWLRNTSNVSANYTAQLGDTYSFTSQATDNLDDTEAVHTSADATITTAQYPWHNSSNPLDVLGRGTVTPLDALAEIDYINANGLGPLPASVPVGDYDVDVAGTNNLTPLDLLQIIDYLNAHIGDESAVADQPATAFAAASGSSAAAPASPASALGAVAGAAVGELGQESSIPSAIPAAMAVPAASLSPASTVPAATGGVSAATGGASAGSGPAGNTRPTLKLAAVDRAMADESVDW
jgi:hypothetical protein